MAWAPDSPCWVYPTPHKVLGYGMTHVDGKATYTHRAVYEVLVGSIPDGHEIDHLCRNRACYNPRHLEAVTGAVNRRRQADANRKATCPQGHSEFTITKAGKRRCVLCHRERERARRGLAA